MLMSIDRNVYKWFGEPQTGKAPLTQITHASAKNIATRHAVGDTRRMVTVGALRRCDLPFDSLEEVLERGVPQDPEKLYQELYVIKSAP